ncbi:MerR family transcriptional regulator [Cohnella caldifontis]|uniref:MerR family transcriptional regulator n=1 Tax=Cohnella caldifontis TaxID=3027471 RepID=UPI0023EBC34A|nr:MerR family transcriptional regulator [Cohnella sp. YIM B05605]
MPYTVKEVAELSGVTVKTLHHYHKIGLLEPSGVTEAGYRVYDVPQLERLQQILFYRELDFPLGEIKRLLQREPERQAILAQQRKLLLDRKQRLARLLETLEESLDRGNSGQPMETRKMFVGFLREEEWREALAEQNRHLRDAYGFDLLAETENIQVTEMNESAREAVRFMNGMAEALRSGARHDDAAVRELIGEHLAFLSEHGHDTDPGQYAAQTRFFLQDDFHRSMLEGQQTGLAYYMCLAAEAYAAAESVT